MDVNCLDCDGLLFKKVPLDNKGNWAIEVETPAMLEQDERDSFFLCPHCSAKNVVVDGESPTGLPGIRIVRARKN